MHATPIRSAGKPKVVTIFRPMSVSTKSTPQIEESPSPDQPSTPTRICQEISVFSPDTPVKHSCRTSTYSRTSLRPTPLTPHRYRLRSFPEPHGSSWGRSFSTKYSPELSPPESQNKSRAELSNYAVTSPRHTPPPVISPTGEAATWSRCRKLEGILEAVSEAMDTFPDGMLRLDSPTVLALRTPHSLDEMHIDALQRIFPQTASLLLSALAAHLIVDSYFSGIREMCSPFSNLPHHHFWRNHGKLAVLSDECLHQIPVKARATLGIHLPNVTDLQGHERALRRRADMVVVGVRIQGQKLLEAICGRFDEVVWRSLKVIVETLEGDRL